MRLTVGLEMLYQVALEHHSVAKQTLVENRVTMRLMHENLVHPIFLVLENKTALLRALGQFLLQLACFGGVSVDQLAIESFLFCQK